ncbi:NUDIX domain-containing protein [Rufibacter sp. LB8]|uniref:NUDIX domain-containing protein n=1 Tax=Rufibacter sp. LB8 TaxID=2777781 RepID=UPI00178C2A19|nr:NUDIX hydrolase [Rufibacter sp. LB8]
MKITDKETLYQGHYKLQLYTVTDGEKEFKREVYHTGTAASALVYDTKKQKFIFARQYRPAMEQDLLEIVAGMLDSPDENPEDAVKREMEEEIGYAVDELQLIHEFYPAPGAVAEKVFLFYAQVSHQVSEGGGKDSEHEDIEIVEMTPQEMLDHTFYDGKTIMAIEWAKNHVLPTLMKS